MKLFEFRKSCFYALLLHPTEAKVLIQSSNDIYDLPYIEINKAIWLDNFQAIKDAFEQKISISVNVLHYATYEVNKKQRQITGIYVLEKHNPTEEISIGTWCDRSTLDGLSFTYDEHKSIVQQYLRELESGNTSTLRPSWTQAGWLSEASTWIEEQLDKLNYKPIAPLEYVRSCSISCVLKIKTTKGTVYFKQAATDLPLFCDEPIVTLELAKIFPQHLPTVIGIDRQRHWMLLADFGKSIIGSNASLKVQADIYRVLAQIQIQSVSQCDRLLEIGCLDRRLNILHSQIDPLMNDEDALSELSTAQIERLQALVPELKNLCGKLASYKIPETLVHGDLHFHNVALHNDNYLFFDWTDSCISHPFFDLFELFFDRNQSSFLGRFLGLWTRQSQKRLWNQYLSQWTDYESPERLLDAWNIAMPLCALHHAVTYQNILNNLEARSKQEMSSALPYFLQEIIRCNFKLP